MTIVAVILDILGIGFDAFIDIRVKIRLSVAQEQGGLAGFFERFHAMRDIDE